MLTLFLGAHAVSPSHEEIGVPAFMVAWFRGRCRVEYGGAGWTSAPARREDGEGEMSQKACGLSEIIVGRGQMDEENGDPNNNNSSNNTNQIIVVPDLEL